MLLTEVTTAEDIAKSLRRFIAYKKDSIAEVRQQLPELWSESELFPGKSVYSSKIEQLGDLTWSCELEYRIPHAPIILQPCEVPMNDITKTLRHKSFHQLLVEDFMRLAGQEVPTKPIMPSQEIRLLRARLILEEALETIEALGFKITAETTQYQSRQMAAEGKVPFEILTKLDIESSGEEPDIVKIVDGCCDIKVVTTGTLSACGVDDAYMQHLIDQANLKKFGPGGYRRDDGKWIKPPDWVAPDPQIVEHLLATGYQPE